MPFSIECEAQGLIFHMSGIISTSDLLSLDKTLYSYKGFQFLQYLIIDYRKATAFEMSEEDVLYVAKQDTSITQ